MMVEQCSSSKYTSVHDVPYGVPIWIRLSQQQRTKIMLEKMENLLSKTASSDPRDVISSFCDVYHVKATCEENPLLKEKLFEICSHFRLLQDDTEKALPIHTPLRKSSRRNIVQSEGKADMESVDLYVIDAARMPFVFPGKRIGETDKDKLMRIFSMINSDNFDSTANSSAAKESAWVGVNMINVIVEDPEHFYRFYESYKEFVFEYIKFPDSNPSLVKEKTHINLEEFVELCAKSGGGVVKKDVNGLQSIVFLNFDELLSDILEENSILSDCFLDGVLEEETNKSKGAARKYLNAFAVELMKGQKTCVLCCATVRFRHICGLIFSCSNCGVHYHSKCHIPSIREKYVVNWICSLCIEESKGMTLESKRAEFSEGTLSGISERDRLISESMSMDEFGSHYEEETDNTNECDNNDHHYSKHIHNKDKDNIEKGYYLQRKKRKFYMANEKRGIKRMAIDSQQGVSDSGNVLEECEDELKQEDKSKSKRSLKKSNNEEEGRKGSISEFPSSDAEELKIAKIFACRYIDEVIDGMSHMFEASSDQSKDMTDKSDDKNFGNKRSSSNVEESAVLSARPLSDTLHSIYKMEYLAKMYQESYRRLSWISGKRLVEKHGADSKIRFFHRKYTEGVIKPYELSRNDEGNIKLYQQIDKVLSIRRVSPPTGRLSRPTRIKSMMQREFLVKWHLLGYNECTWENENDLTSNADQWNIENYRKVNTAFSFPDVSFCIGQNVTDAKDVEMELKLVNPRLQSEDGNSKLWTTFVSQKVGEGGQLILVNKLHEYNKMRTDSETFDIMCTLMNHQLEGIKWFFYNHEVRNHGSLLADEMGLGKTCQAILFLEHLLQCRSVEIQDSLKYRQLRDMGKSGEPEKKIGSPHALVIVQKTTLENWRREFYKWAPNLNVVPFHGSREDRGIIIEFEKGFENPETGDIVRQPPKKNKGKGRWRQYSNVSQITTKQIKPDVVLCTYESLRSKEFGQFVDDCKWSCMIVDECQKVKAGRGSALLMTLTQIQRDVCILLTGTPIQNTTEELFPLLSLLDPNRFTFSTNTSAAWTESKFQSHFAGLQNREDCMKATEQLQRLLQAYLLRREKTEVLKMLPPKLVKIIKIPLTVIQKKVYSGIYHRSVKARGLSLNNIHIQLRKCCIHPYLLQGMEEMIMEGKITADSLMALIDDNTKSHETMQNQKNTETPNNGTDESHNEFQDKSPHLRLMLECSGKFILLDKMLRHFKSQCRKVLIFSFFKGALDLIEELVGEYEWPLERVDGDTTAEDRQLIIDRFNTNTDRFIFLCTTRAGGVGINLTSATVVIHMDPDFNPQQDLQAQSRCHRIGQRQNVDVFHLIAEHSYEDYMLFTVASRKLGLEAVLLGRLDATCRGEINKKNKKLEEAVLKRGLFAALRDDDSAMQEAARFAQLPLESILTEKAATLALSHEDDKNIHDSEENLLMKSQKLFSTTKFVAYSHDASADENILEGLDDEDPEFWSKVADRLDGFYVEEESAPTTLSRADRRKGRVVDYRHDLTGEQATGSEEDSYEEEDEEEDDDEVDVDEVNDEIFERALHHRVPKVTRRTFAKSSGNTLQPIEEGYLYKSIEPSENNNNIKSAFDPLFDIITEESWKAYEESYKKLQYLAVYLHVLPSNMAGCQNEFSFVNGRPPVANEAKLVIPSSTKMQEELSTLKLVYQCLRSVDAYLSSALCSRYGIRSEDMIWMDLDGCWRVLDKKSKLPLDPAALNEIESEFPESQTELDILRQQVWRDTCDVWHAAAQEWKVLIYSIGRAIKTRRLISNSNEITEETNISATQNHENEEFYDDPENDNVIQSESKECDVCKTSTEDVESSKLIQAVLSMCMDLSYPLGCNKFSKKARAAYWPRVEELILKLLFLHFYRQREAPFWDKDEFKIAVKGGWVDIKLRKMWPASSEPVIWKLPVGEVDWRLLSIVMNRIVKIVSCTSLGDSRDGAPAERTPEYLLNKYYNDLDARWDRTTFTPNELLIIAAASEVKLPAEILVRCLPRRTLHKVKQAKPLPFFRTLVKPSNGPVANNPFKVSPGDAAKNLIVPDVSSHIPTVTQQKTHGTNVEFSSSFQRLSNSISSKSIELPSVLPISKPLIPPSSHSPQQIHGIVKPRNQYFADSNVKAIPQPAGILRPSHKSGPFVSIPPIPKSLSTNLSCLPRPSVWAKALQPPVQKTCRSTYQNPVNVNKEVCYPPEKAIQSNLVNLVQPSKHVHISVMTPSIQNNEVTRNIRNISDVGYIQKAGSEMISNFAISQQNRVHPVYPKCPVPQSKLPNVNNGPFTYPRMPRRSGFETAVKPQPNVQKRSFVNRPDQQIESPQQPFESLQQPIQPQLLKQPIERPQQPFQSQLLKQSNVSELSCDVLRCIDVLMKSGHVNAAMTLLSCNTACPSQQTSAMHETLASQPGSHLMNHSSPSGERLG